MSEITVNDALSKAEDLYLRLEFLSKILESSGIIDEREHREAYATILDAMRFIRDERF